MIITGTITNAGPASAPSGPYAVRYQDVVIKDNNGYEYTGRIGSKAGYAVNTPIQVTYEMKQGDNGEYMYFKKYNPQYPQGQQGSQQQQAPQQQMPQQAKPGPDWDKIADSKVLCHLIGAAIMGKQISCKTESEAKLWAKVILGRSLVGENMAPPSQPAGPNPDYDPDYHSPDNSDIPF